jgi:hypothetical protein
VRALRGELRAQLGADVEHDQDAADDADDEVDDLQQAGGGRDVEAGQPVVYGRDQRPSGDQREETTGDDGRGLESRVVRGARERHGDAHHRGRHGRDRELVELRQPAPRAQPCEPVAEHRPDRRQYEDEPVAADEQ